MEEFQRKLVTEQDKLRQLLPQEHHDDGEGEKEADGENAGVVAHQDDGGREKEAEDVEHAGVVAQQVVIVKYLKVGGATVPAHSVSCDDVTTRHRMQLISLRRCCPVFR